MENKLDFTGDISEAMNRSLPPGILSMELNLTAPHAARDRAPAAADHSTFDGRRANGSLFALPIALMRFVSYGAAQ